MAVFDTVRYIDSDDAVVAFVPWQPGLHLYSKFAPERFRQIIPWCKSDEEFDGFIEQYSDILSCWIVTERATGRPFGFIYCELEPQACQPTVSLHGGCWEQSLGFARLVLRGYITFIEMALNHGYHVWTETNKHNLAAVRLARAMGYVKYCETSERIYFWINRQRLYGSKYYTLFFNR